MTKTKESKEPHKEVRPYSEALKMEVVKELDSGKLSVFAVDLFCIVIIVRSVKQPQVVFGISPSTGKRHNVINFSACSSFPPAASDAPVSRVLAIPELSLAAVLLSLSSRFK